MSATRDRRQIALWLFTCCVLVFGMVVIGGLTRLTGSGLSMVDWSPVLGWFPPMDQAAWERVFTLYQTSPEFKIVNQGMDLEGFKGIFWLEFIHRLLGRMVGVVFLLPFLYFRLRGKLEPGMTPKLLGMFILGGLQGVLGWYMVKSGLVDDPHVSPYRLTAHLGLAMIIFVVMFWTALGLWYGKEKHPCPGSGGLGAAALFLSIWVFLTALSGGFVAGLHAGKSYNTFPLMAGQWMPDELFHMRPWYLNLFEDIATVQWDHRLLATVTFALVLLLWFWSGRAGLSQRLRRGFHLMLGMVGIQVALGISTLLLEVPIKLASAHQAGALLLFSLALYNAFRLRYPPQGC